MIKTEVITNLAAALIAFHGEVGKVSKDGTNPHFKNRYASLSNILDTVNPVLTKNGLAIIQIPCGTCHLETILLHSSGEYISEVFEMTPTKADPQGVGSAMTYARRYAIGAILSLNIDEDDDGNKASQPAAKPKTSAYAALYDEATAQLERATTLEAIKSIFDAYTDLKEDKDFIAACAAQKKKLTTPVKK